MALQIGRALGRGIRRATNSTGVVLMVLTFLYTLVFVGSMNAIVVGVLPRNVRQQGQFGLTFPLSASVAGVLLVLAFLFSFVVILAATRAFTREPGTGSTLSADLFTRRIGGALASMVGAELVVSVATTIGFVLLVVPGLFLAVSFVFVVFAIGVEDARAVDALRRSWDLARGHRLRLFLLVLVVGVATGLVSSLGSLLSITNPVAGQVVSLALAAVFSILGYGVLADAYVQVRDGA